MGRKKKSFIDKMERKYGRYAINNISLYLIICYAFGYIMQMINPTFIYFLTLNFDRIMHGEVWRLVSWILIPPTSSNLFFTLIMLYFYYSIGTSLESVWGTFRYNLYLFSGMLFTIVGAFLIYIIVQFGVVTIPVSQVDYFYIISTMFSTYYINMSIFLAYAATFPNMRVMLMMLIPIKVKAMGIIYGIILVVELIQSPFEMQVVIAASLLNFVLFFLMILSKGRMTPKQKKRQREFKREVEIPTMGPRHRCSICGKTEADGADLEFRYCTKCKGNHEYCQEHLFTHEHKN